MDAKRIKDLVDLVADSRVTEIELVEGETRIRIHREPLRVEIGAAIPRAGSNAPPRARRLAQPASSSAAQDQVRDPFIAAPFFGLLHLTPSPGAPSFVQVGERVRRGQKLALIEAMKVFNTIECDRDGVLGAILVEAGDEVELGQKLFRIDDAT